MADVVVDYLRDRAALALLIVDDCEHLAAACVELIEQLLVSCVPLGCWPRAGSRWATKGDHLPGAVAGAARRR